MNSVENNIKAFSGKKILKNYELLTVGLLSLMDNNMRYFHHILSSVKDSRPTVESL